MSDLDELKKLLFGAEKQALDSITERVESIEVRTVDVSAVLPEAIHQSHGEGQALKESLRGPVGDCLRDEFHEDPQTYGDALYPVMGPAIRKSIVHTLRTFAQQINEAVEHSFTPRGLSWRLQAWRAGVPFGQFVLQKTLLYRVEQAYLISRDSGLLIGHAQHELSQIKDSDAVSAMFTAIQDFVKESFSPDRTGRLESADMGEFTLWAVHGPHALLVCVIRGVPPKALRADLSAILERIHFRYADAIRSYKGDTASVPDIDAELEDCLKLEARQAQDSKSFKPTPAMWIVLALIAGLLGWYTVSNWTASNTLARLTAALDDAPGIFVAEASRSGGTFTVRGLRDPVADEAIAIASAVGVEADKLEADLKPYQSLEPEIIVRRAARALEPPDGVSFSVDGSVLTASGPSLPAWQASAEARIDSISGVETLRFVQTDADKVIVTRQFLEAPGSVEIVASDEGLSLRGTATSAWIASAQTRLAEESLAWTVTVDSVVADELAVLERLVGGLDEREFYFSDGATLVDGGEAELAAFADDMAEAVRIATELGVTLDIAVTGYTDRIGDDLRNVVVAEARVARLLAAFAEAGIDDAAIQRLSVLPDEGEIIVDPGLRRATIDIIVNR